MDERHFGEAPGTTSGSEPQRSLRAALRKGLRRRCPRCGEGRLFSGLLTVRPRCESCGLDFSGHRADDLPPYLTIVVVAKLLIPFILLVERVYAPPTIASIIVWSLLVLLLSIVLLPPIKGAVIGLQWAYRMHGFGSGDGWADRPADNDDEEPAATPR